MHSRHTSQMACMPSEAGRKSLGPIHLKDLQKKKIRQNLVQRATLIRLKVSKRLVPSRKSESKPTNTKVPSPHKFNSTQKSHRNWKDD